MSALTTLTSKLAATLNMGDGAGLIETLKATAFKGQVSDAQMTALMVVANQYGLNPWTKEIYAFPDKQNGIVPVVGVDGWARIINEHPQFDGMEFEQDAEQCTCTIYRKDRAHPVSVTEYADECKRNTGPWGSHPRRMLRHKALVQCARLAFGYAGIYDQDEAERIVEGAIVSPPPYDLPKKREAIEAPAPLADEQETKGTDQ
jgi:phage recombination protein Bet